MPHDLTGYEILIEEIIRPNHLLGIAGDFLEIGALVGGGTVKLAALLENAKIPKELWVVESFAVDADRTVNTQGQAMNDLYRPIVGSEGGWREGFLEATSRFSNIRLFDVDSLHMHLPEKPLAFAFVDGAHDRAHVLNDFNECWRRLVPGGVLALHDYGGDLPEVTAAINEGLDVHAGEIEWTRRIRWNPLISIKKTGASAPDRLRPRIAVLFCHHQKDPNTLHHLDLLRASNADDPLMEIIPCCFPESEGVADALILSPDPRLPRNTAARVRGRGGEIDLLLYQFFLTGRADAYDRIVILESNCRVTESIRQVYAYDFNVACGGSHVRLGPVDCSAWYHWVYLPEWKRLLIDRHAAGITPLNGIILTLESLARICEGIVRSPRLFENMFSELRLGVACRMFAGDPATLRWMEHSNEWFESSARNPSCGFLHPVKSVG